MIFRRLIEKIIPSYRLATKLDGKLNRLNNRLSYKLNSLDKKLDSLQDLDNKIEYLFFLSQRLKNETELETRKRVFLEIPNAYGRIRDIQLAENYILQRVKKYADELNIVFFLMGGTALGAVRHNGFIPWDDDIDIGILQEDYFRLKEIIDTDELIKSERYYTLDGGSVVKVKFRFTENFFIDIFPFEFISTDENNISVFWEKSQEMTKTYSDSIAGKIHELGLTEKAKVAPVYTPELDDYATRLYQNIQTELKSDSINNRYLSESIANGYEFRKSRGYWKYEDVFPFRKDEVDFEGQKYSMINNYIDRMQVFLGDYWKLPSNISNIHNDEFDENIKEDINRLKEMGII